MRQITPFVPAFEPPDLDPVSQRLAPLLFSGHQKAQMFAFGLRRLFHRAQSHALRDYSRMELAEQCSALRHKGNLGAKPKAEVIAEILAAIKERRL